MIKNPPSEHSLEEALPQTPPAPFLSPPHELQHFRRTLPICAWADVRPEGHFGTGNIALLPMQIYASTGNRSPIRFRGEGGVGRVAESGSRRSARFGARREAWEVVRWERGRQRGYRQGASLAVSDMLSTRSPLTDGRRAGAHPRGERGARAPLGTWKTLYFQGFFVKLRDLHIWSLFFETFCYVGGLRKPSAW